MNSGISHNESIKCNVAYNPMMMRRFMAGTLAAICLGAVACSSGSAARHAALTGSRPSRSVPGCTTTVAKGPALPAAATAMTKVTGAPFGVAVTADGRYDMVSTGSVIVVLRNGSPAGPSLARVVRLPAAGIGETLTPDGRYLLVANGRDGAAVLSVQGVADGKPDAVAGTLATGRPAISGGAIEVAVSRDGHFAFVSLEGSGRVAVFNLSRALASGFGQADYAGAIPVGEAPVGLATSPDGRWLYATSELAARPGPTSLARGHGTLSVIDVSKAETDPAASVVATVDAGCQPVRVITSADGATVWVTARASDALLAFSAAKLVADPRRALISAVTVGEAPVGLALVNGGSRIVVADSNRFNAPGASSSLAVVDVRAALAGRPALIGYLKAGLFPREMAVVPGGRTLLVTDNESGQLESVDLARLP